MNESAKEIVYAVADLLRTLGNMRHDNRVATKTAVHYIENAKIAIANAIRMEEGE